jgi:hypothetical protein
LPTHLWTYGTGGPGGNHPEYDRRLRVLTEVRREYVSAFPGRLPFIETGIDPVPPSWINKRLEELSESWRVEMGDGGYILPPLSAARN